MAASAAASAAATTAGPIRALGSLAGPKEFRNVDIYLMHAFRAGGAVEQRPRDQLHSCSWQQMQALEPRHSG